jgi:hypothetical protein
MRYAKTQITRKLPANKALLTKVVAAFLALGVLAFFAFNSAAAQQPRYVINGFELGGRIASAGAVYRAYTCRASDQFSEFTRCTRAESGREQRGPFEAFYSLLHDDDGTIVYINRSQEPAYWGLSEVGDDIAQYSRRHGEGPRLIKKMPSRGTLKGTLAVWGDVELEELDQRNLGIVAQGKSPRQGILTDYIGDFGRSAREGLPVYRLAGGAGLVWVASYEPSGHGTLRFFAVNPAAFSTTVGRGGGTGPKSPPNDPRVTSPLPPPPLPTACQRYPNLCF